MRNIGSYLLFILAGLSFAQASFRGETAPGAVFVLLFAVLFCYALQSAHSRSTRAAICGAYLSGISFSSVAFYWLFDTIMFFGGFPLPVALGIFVLFVLTSALQFAFVAWLYSRLSLGLPRLLALPRELSIAISWAVAECLFPRMFPWSLAHPLAGLPTFSGTAEFFGVIPLAAFVMFWGVSLSLPLFQETGLRRAAVSSGAAVTLSLVLLCLGLYRQSVVTKELMESPALTVALVQGNVAAKDKGNLRLIDVNIETYRELSQRAELAGAELLIWPESVVNQWIPEELENLNNTSYQPLSGNKLPLLFGGLSFRARTQEEMSELFKSNPDLRSRAKLVEQLKYHKYNASFGIDSEGNVLGRYYKRILMPFGEYIPFADRFLWLRSISPQTGDFSSGKIISPITFSIPKPSSSLDVRIGVLICYEDLLPSLSREAVAEGANLLVNLTNDAWYGETAAPYQHHLLALWRAIETRRYLLRSTNTGYTALVDPFGRSYGGLPLFTEAVLLEQVKLLEGQTLYSKMGDLPFKIISVLVLLFALLIQFFPKYFAIDSRKQS